MDNKSNKNLHDIRIITFNLLSQEVATRDILPYVQKIYLDWNGRVEKTKKLIQSWMKVNFIICLQELSTQWKEALGPFFNDNNYGFCTETYSDGKMGVGIAFPSQHFDLLDTDIFTCGNYIKPIYDSLKTISNDNELLTQLEFASKSANTMISILLKAKYFGKYINKNVVVSTYHMPCRYKYKLFITAHIHALKVHLENLTTKWNTKYSNTMSTILAGDFNITPKCPEYNFLVGLEYDAESTQAPAPAQFIDNLAQAYKSIGINLYTGIILKSVHKTLHTKEPYYTNVSINKDNIFTECIDYILINKYVDIRSCTVGLTVVDPNTTPYPNGLCPSDHLPLSASLRIS